MEIPSDVLSVVREFSKPLLRYPAEYKEALCLLEKKEWSELKSKLSSSEADEVVLLLKIYMDACKARSICEEEFIRMDDIISEEFNDEKIKVIETGKWEEYKRLNVVYKMSIVKELDALTELNKKIAL
jgi:hypothetical protein